MELILGFYPKRTVLSVDKNINTVILPILTREQSAYVMCGNADVTSG
jgi:hypothetical protein